jgi:hypothetical protein
LATRWPQQRRPTFPSTFAIRNSDFSSKPLHRFSKNFLKFDIENQESTMESQTPNFLCATDMPAFGSPAYQLRRAREMQMLTAPVSQDGLGLNPAQVQDKTAAATLSVCKVLYNRSFEPNAVGHELFQLLVWKHIHLSTCESCALPRGANLFPD